MIIWKTCKYPFNKKLENNVGKWISSIKTWRYSSIQVNILILLIITIINSTCSYSEKQNEDIIQWFISRNKNSQLEYVQWKDEVCKDDDAMDQIKLSRRFSPETTNTSGLFITKIKKLYII